MSYRFDPSDPDVEKALHRIADEQFAGALRAVESDGPMPPRVHEMRKSVKKLRGLLRLVRPAFKRFKAENTALRDAARGLTVLREADVNLRTLDRLLPETDLAPASATALRAAVAGAHAAHPDAASPSGALAIFGRRMIALRARAQTWHLKADGFGTLAGGLEKTWTQARARMAPALADPSVEAVHEWRKRVKDHWYQARLLSPIWSEAMAAHVAAADRLGEALGDHHDLAVLIDALAHLNPEVAEPVIVVARKHQDALMERARIDARRLFADSAACLVGRWQTWWQVWRDREAGG